MKSNLGKKARLLALLVLAAVLPLGIGACGDGGDSESGPTGPSTQYNPDIDYPSATITAVANRSTVAPGGEFDIIATFKDGNGFPVQGVPLYVLAEGGGAGGDFSYKTNPTITDGSGKASIGVVVSAGCPNGSYQFTIYSVRAAEARGYVGVVVGAGGGGGGTAAVTSAALTAVTPTVTLGQAPVVSLAASATPSCTLRFTVTAVGDGISLVIDLPANTGGSLSVPIGPPDYTAPTTTGPLVVSGIAYCNGVDGSEILTTPNSVTIQVTAAP